MDLSHCGTRGELGSGIARPDGMFSPWAAGPRSSSSAAEDEVELERAADVDVRDPVRIRTAELQLRSGGIEVVQERAADVDVRDPVRIRTAELQLRSGGIEVVQERAADVDVRDPVRIWNADILL